MATQQIVNEIDNQLGALTSWNTAHGLQLSEQHLHSPNTGDAKKRTMSEKTKAQMAEAQSKRWEVIGCLSS